MRFEMTKVRLFQYLKKKFKSSRSIRMILFLWINLVKIFILFDGYHFLEILDGIEEKATKHQAK